MKKLLVAMLLLFPLPALAETYQWTDESGTMNFAEDLGKVPKKYRKKARLVGDEGGGAPKVTEESVAAEPAKGGKPKADQEEPGSKLFGGKDGNAWRKEFLAARYNMQQSESELADLKGRLGDTSKMSRSEYLSIQAGIKHLETRLQQQQKKMEQLKESADKAKVPAELRQ